MEGVDPESLIRLARAVAGHCPSATFVAYVGSETRLLGYSVLARPANPQAMTDHVQSRTAALGASHAVVIEVGGVEASTEAPATLPEVSVLPAAAASPGP